MKYTQIKIFVGEDREKLEDEVNSWLSDDKEERKKIQDIKISYQAGAENEGWDRLTIVIIYTINLDL